MDPVSEFNSLISLALALLITKVVSLLAPVKLDQVKFTSIDGLRGYLAFFVFLHHAVIWYYYLHTSVWEAPPSNLYNHFGQSSVAMFFMITGLLFFTMLMDKKSKSFDWLRLFVSRVLRLTPLYLFAMIIMMTIIVILSDFSLHKPAIQVFAEVIAWLSFAIPGAPNINGVIDTWRITAGVTWSLMYEWLFYLSLPIIGLVLFKLRSSVLLLVINGFIVLVVSVFKGPLLIHVLSFSGGIIAAFLVRSEQFCKFASGKLSSIGVLICLISAVVFYKSASLAVPLALISIAFITFAAGNNLFGLLNLPVSRILGKMSYSIYLLHGIVLFITFRFIIGYSKAATFSATQHWFVVFASIIPLIIVCYFAHIFIELPGMSFNNSLTLIIRNSFHVFRNRFFAKKSTNRENPNLKP